MDYTEFEQAHLAMRNGLDSRPTELGRLGEQLYHAAARYAELRVRWRLAPQVSRQEIDQERTRAHNALIDCCNALSRAMRKLELPTDWRRLIGDDANVEGRKRVGDYACFLFLALSLEAR